MAKAYWIGRVEVNNEEGYKPYVVANADIFRKYHGKFVVRADTGYRYRAEGERTVKLPGKPYMALRIRRVV